jgi:hypothetical protein
MTTEPKAPRKTQLSIALTPRMFFAGQALNALVAGDREHLMDAHRPAYLLAVRGHCRTAFEIADEMVRRAAL